jgi:hypothetical protein
MANMKISGYLFNYEWGITDKLGVYNENVHVYNKLIIVVLVANKFIV